MTPRSFRHPLRNETGKIHRQTTYYTRMPDKDVHCESKIGFDIVHPTSSSYITSYFVFIDHVPKCILNSPPKKTVILNVCLFDQPD